MLGAMTPQQVEQLLATEHIGRIGLHGGDRTSVLPVTYADEANSIIGHALARENRLLPLITTLAAQPTHGLHPPAPQRLDASGYATVVWRIDLGEKTGRFAQH